MPVPMIPVPAGTTPPPPGSGTGLGYQQLTRAQFRAQLLDRLGGAGQTFWRTDELNGIIQEALRVWNSLTGFWRTRQLITTVADQTWYVVAGSITSSLRVMFNDHPLLPSALYDLDTSQQYWESETTATRNVPDEPAVYGIGALNLISIWPADHAGGNRLVVDGIAQTPILTSDSSYVDIGEEELSLLLDYCEHIALFKEGGAEFMNTIPGKDQATEASPFGRFLAGAAARNAMLARSEWYRKWLGGDASNQGKNPVRANPARAGAR
jgi:hypothetical protein